MAERLQQLRAAIRDLAARADRINTDFRTRLAKERLRGKALLEARAKQSEALLAETHAAGQAALAAAVARGEKRAAWIGRALVSAKEAALRTIDDEVGARKYQLQRTLLQAEKERDKAISEAAAARKDFLAALEAEHQHLAEAETAAARAFRGYSALHRVFTAAYESPTPDTVPDEHRLLERLRGLLGTARESAQSLKAQVPLNLLRFLPVWLVLALTVFVLPLILREFGGPAFTYGHAALVVGGLIALVVVVRGLLTRSVRPRARELSAGLAETRRLLEVCAEKCEGSHRRHVEAAQQRYAEITQNAEQEFRQASAKAGERRVACRMRADERALAATAHHQTLHQVQLAARQERQGRELDRLRQENQVAEQAVVDANQASETRLQQAFEAEWKVLHAEWQERLGPLYSQLQDSAAEVRALFPPWAQVIPTWSPPSSFAHAAAFATLKVDVETLAEGLPSGQRLPLPGPAAFDLPLALQFPAEGSILFETGDSGNADAIGALNNIVLRLLSAAPPGRLNFTVIDPVGLGRNFAGVMHLADYEEQLIHSRIWTQSTQVEQRLADLNEHIEKVIQMYLRNEYPTIADYNAQAGVIAEKYHFLVVADFPAAFTDTAARRLLSIAASGARCGVFMLIHWDRRQPLPQDFLPEELRRSCFCLEAKAGAFRLLARAMPGVELTLDPPPPAADAIEFIHRVGRVSKDSSRVEVPFEQVMPNPEQVWTLETTVELRVPVGRTGATKLQYLELGKGTRQHGLIAGKTGSGKSTLFHVLITNLALWCSPEQVEFYLVDFKKGVEFKCYATHRLPHARVVAIESDREFGLSVLQRIDDELRRRGDLFRKLGVQDLPGYKRAGGSEPIPRTLLLIDEFQEFFVEDDKIAQTAALLLDRLVRQGRAFGIHVVLGSQTLGGAYTMARTTLGQMVVRIALQCNEADAYLIMDDNNPAPRLLSRPGEAIYNDASGALEGNSPFQVVWLSDAERDVQLQRVRQHATSSGRPSPGPIVFEGNAPADVRENLLLETVLARVPSALSLAPRLWLGAPNSIKGPTEVVFHRQSGNNLLLVGQSEEAAMAIMGIGLIALASQFPPGTARFVLLDGTAPGSPQRAFFEQITTIIPHGVATPRQGDLGELMAQLARELKERSESPDPDQAPAVFLLVQGLQKYNKLRHEEDFSFSSADDTPPSPAAVLNRLLTEGTRLGFHVLAACDTYNNVTRFLSRKALSEFEMRVLFQMSANDSASLIDNPKASTLGLNRALLFNEQEGYLETFRPYSLPPGDWLNAAAQHLAQRHSDPTAKPQ